ncbi:MAG: mechanosensitive ion channel [Nitrospirae bacterium]|nr:mechanosensitive ion channel [Nitrospirota bacterium]
MGKTPVTLAGIIDFAIIILFGFIFRSLIHKALRSRVQSQSSPQTRHLMGLLSTLASNLVLGLAVIIALDNLGVRLSFLGGALGVLGIGFGIGLQTLAGNMIGLIVILLEKSIQVDDLIEVDGVLGTVVEIKARSTTIMSRDNIAIIIPNSHLIANKVINWSHRDRKTRMHLKVGIGMDAARLDHAVVLLKEIASSHPEVLRDPPPDVWFSEFGPSSFNLEVIYWIEDGTRRHNVLSDLNFAIARRFAQEKIELPYPHTVVLLPEKPEGASADLAVGPKTDA